jgi:hypothetical protein
LHRLGFLLGGQRRPPVFQQPRLFCFVAAHANSANIIPVPLTDFTALLSYTACHFSASMITVVVYSAKNADFPNLPSLKLTYSL